MTVDKLYMSLTANHIMAKLTNHVQRTRLYNIIDDNYSSLDSEDDFRTHRLSKRQSPTTVLFRSTLTRTITLYELLGKRLAYIIMLRSFVLFSGDLLNNHRPVIPLSITKHS